jgi:hypothetical protein
MDSSELWHDALLGAKLPRSLKREARGKQLRGGLSEVVRRQLCELGFEKEGSPRKAAA